MLKNFYVPYEEYYDKFYWDAPPVCVDFETLRDLANGWSMDLEELLKQVRKATQEEIEQRGTYDSDA